MTSDQRIETLTMHLEALTGMHKDFEKRVTQYSADVKDAIGRLRKSPQRTTTTIKGASKTSSLEQRALPFPLRSVRIFALNK